MKDTIQIEYLGHAGFVVHYAGKQVLIDPWFYPAFLKSWFPFPDNRFLAESLAGRRFDFLYVSHTHEDHFDIRFLQHIDRETPILCPAFRSKGLLKKFTALGFSRFVHFGHKRSIELAPGFTATMFLDGSHKEDSGLLLDMGGFRFLDLNDCNTPLSELPSGVDLLGAQFSGAMWYPNCYDYPPEVMRDKVVSVRGDLLNSVVHKCRMTQAKVYLPSAGPPCFLDPSLAAFNDRDQTIFPDWDGMESQFRNDCPDTRAIRLNPGDELHVRDGDLQVQHFRGQRPDSSVEIYRERRRTEWTQFYESLDQPVTHSEVIGYFNTLHRRNQHLLHDFSKTVKLAADGQVWTVKLGQLAEDFVIEGEEPYPADYALAMSNRILRAVVDNDVGWEEALLSLRLRLHRDPDVFDSRFMGLLRYGNEPMQTLQMAREATHTEMIERDGLRMRRYCPHAGEDLTFATICHGVIECPRHRWRWDAKSGECIAGGNLRLHVESLRTADVICSSVDRADCHSSSQQRRTIDDQLST